MNLYERGDGDKVPGKLTGGEARTLAAMITGCDPTDVKAFILVTIHKCPDCGVNHGYASNTDLTNQEVVTVLGDVSVTHIKKVISGEA